MRPLSHKSVLTLALGGVLVMSSIYVALADDDADDDAAEYPKNRERITLPHRLPAVVNATYNQECGACHLAYQPELLPPTAWAQLLTTEALQQHYGDDASLSEALLTEIRAFLGVNTAAIAAPSGAGDAQPSATLTNSLPRITTSQAFQRKHDEIPLAWVTENPEVGSFSQCNACHRKAAEGDYNERWIDIPGHGVWDD